MPWIEHLARDLRNACRTIARMPLLAAVVVLSLGAGIGANLVVFSWLQAVTVPPIEAYAVIHYAGYYWSAIYDPNANCGSGNVTHWGFVLEIALMAVFTALNFLPMRIYGPLYSVVTWWKVIIPVLTIIILLPSSTARA